MKHKDIHIVFGPGSRGTLRVSGVVPENSAEIVCMYDVLTYGPLLDIPPSAAEIQERKEWLSKMWPIDCYDEPDQNIVDRDTTIIQSLAGRETGRIFFWTGRRAGEILGTARLFTLLAGYGREIYIADFPNVAVSRWDGAIIYPDSLSMTAPEQVGEIARRFRRVGEEELPRWSDIWREALSDGAMLRILDEEGQISGVDISWFDRFLESRCTDEFQKAARIIGMVLTYDMWGDVGDGYLNWRLKALVESGRLQARGLLNQIRDYEVRLPALE